MMSLFILMEIYYIFEKGYIMQRIQLILNLKADNLSVNSTRLITYLHGVLMETIHTDYADKLHNQQFNPYSMHLYSIKNCYCWEINLLTKEAIDEIGKVILNERFNAFKIKSLDDMEVMIDEKKTEVRTKDNLADTFYRGESKQNLHIKFDSSTAFKQAGEYVFHPDIRLIFQNILMRYHFLYEEEKEIEEEILDEIIKAIKITSYNVQSSYYPIHRSRIPAFRGEIKIRIEGNDTIKNYILMLLKFAEYSGVGIKTSLGMGSIRLLNERRRNG